MAEPRTPDVEVPPVEATNESGPETDEVLEELLVEEISIDGMCGVY